MNQSLIKFLESLDTPGCTHFSFCTAFKCIMESIQILIDYDHLNIWLLNSEQVISNVILPLSLSLVASKGEGFAQQLESTYLSVDNSFSGKTVLLGKIIRKDLKNEDKFQNLNMVRVVGAKSVISVPMFSPKYTGDKKLVGIINFYFKRSCRGSDATFEFIAYHVSKVIERLRLIHRDRVTSELLHYSANSLNLHFEKSAEQMLNYGAEAVSIFSFHRRRKKLILVYSTGLTNLQNEHDEITYELGDGLTGIVAESLQPLIIHDLKDEKLANIHAGFNIEQTKHPIKSFISCPIKNKDGQLIGVIRCVNKIINQKYLASFSQLDLEILERISGILCQHLERNRLEIIRESLLAKIPHDLKSPIIGVKNIALQIKKYHRSGNININRKTTDIVDDCNLMLCLISQIQSKTDYSFVLTTTKGPIFIKLIKQLRPFIRNYKLKSIDYENLDILDIPIYVDINQMQRLFFNLLMNAIKYSYPETDIVVSAKEQDDDFISITVKNWGIGIEEKYRSAVFRPEFRSPEAEKRVNGTGWGLSISKEIAEKHGGRIEIENLKDPTEFSLFLPKYLRYRCP